jgi:hypothetical protein
MLGFSAVSSSPIGAGSFQSAASFIRTTFVGHRFIADGDSYLLKPPIFVDEQGFLTFDFGSLVGAGETIEAVVSISCSVVKGSDLSPASRVLGAPEIKALS